MTHPDQWPRLKRVLGPALELPPERIPEYLDRALPDDIDLRHEAERVLRACARASDALRCLDGPALAFAAPLLELGPPTPDELEAGEAVGPYVVERALGAGGMGAVYLARDPRLDRQVALKLLPPWVRADDSAVRRITREAVAASQLDHPNIQTVYGIGRAGDGRPYIAMAYYEGETLQSRIEKGPLEVAAVLDVAGQIADGLAAAHSCGIVHRDIKPSNVIVTPAGAAKILDFGAATMPGYSVPRAGVVTGTVPFMSPEQTRWQSVDGRTDIWSLGVVLYVMLTGRLPFDGPRPDAVIRAIRRGDHEPLSRHRPDVPRALEAIVDRCLRKDPGERFPDADSLARALRRSAGLPGSPTGTRRAHWRSGRFAASVGILALAVGATAVWPTARSGPQTAGWSGAEEGEIVRLAVLPLVDSGPGAEGDYLADGLTEELIAGFAQLASLRVIAPTSALRYRGTAAGPDEIARELGAAALLTGTVRRTGDQVELHARLIDATSREPVWERRYATELGSMATLQRDIVEGAASALQVPLRTAELRSLAGGGTESAEAFEAFLQGRRFLEKLAAPGAAREARRHFERALDADAGFAAAWAGLCTAYHHMAIQEQLPTADAEQRARAAADEALAHDPGLADAYTCRAGVRTWYEWDSEGAERDFRRALELEPSSARAHRWYAVHLRNQGRFDEALVLLDAATALDPLSPGNYLQKGMVLDMARRYDEALATYRHLLRIEPAHQATYFSIALVYGHMGRLDDALDALDRTDPSVNRPSVLAIRAYTLARLGRRAEAMRTLARLDSVFAAPTRTPPALAALVHVALGDLDRALDLLEQGVEERAWQMRLLGVAPEWDPLRSSPRFQALLERLDLAP